MAIIIPRHRRGTWEGVTVATWCSGWICRMRRGLGAHTLFSPASLSLPPMRGAAIGRSPTILQNDSFCTRISNFVQSAIFQLLVFDKVRRWSLRKKGKKQKDFSFLLGTQSEARAGWPTRLRLVRATPWDDFDVITDELWSTIRTIFSSVNECVSTVTYDLDPGITIVLPNRQNDRPLSTQCRSLSVSTLWDALRYLYLRVSAQRFEPGGFIKPNIFSVSWHITHISMAIVANLGRDTDHNSTKLVCDYPLARCIPRRRGYPQVPRKKN